MEGCVKAGISVFQGHPGVLPEGATDLQVGTCSLFKAFCGGACLCGRGGPIWRAQEGRDGGSLGTGSVQAATVLGVASPVRCPLPTPQSSLAPSYLLGMHGSTNGS